MQMIRCITYYMTPRTGKGKLRKRPRRKHARERRGGICKRFANGGGRAKFANDWSHNILHVSTKGEYGEGPDFAND